MEKEKLCRTRRIIFGLVACLLPLMGLAIRAGAPQMPELLAAYLPDILWALLVFALAVVIAPRLPALKVALLALAFAFAVECSQLYHAPWIDALRATRIGGLLLGFGFLWSDLVCYTIGIAFGVAGDVLVRALLLRAPLLRRRERGIEHHDTHHV